VSDYFDRVERQIVRKVEAGLPRARRMPTAFGYVATAAAVAVVIVVAGVFLLARGTGGAGRTGSPAQDAARTVAFNAAPLNLRIGLGPSVLDLAARILRERLGSLVPAARVERVGERIVVRAPNATPRTKALILALATQGNFEIYDWERDVIAPNGKTVATQLRGQDPSAVEISQGSSGVSPGQTGAGSLSLGAALALASKLHAAPGTSGTAGLFQYLDRRTVVMPPGYIILQAASGPQYYVLQDRPSLTRNDIASVEASTDPGTGTPDVAFDLNASGQRALQRLTAVIAQRGELVSGLGQTFDQHLAIAVNDRLIDVPFLDFKQYPDGLDQRQVQLSPTATTPSAKVLATLLRYGPMPVSLRAAG
jgi:hypothetical protein